MIQNSEGAIVDSSFLCAEKEQNIIKIAHLCKY